MWTLTYTTQFLRLKPILVLSGKNLRTLDLGKTLEIRKRLKVVQDLGRTRSLNKMEKELYFQKRP